MSADPHLQRPVRRFARPGDAALGAPVGALPTPISALSDAPTKALPAPLLLLRFLSSLSLPRPLASALRLLLHPALLSSLVLLLAAASWRSSTARLPLPTSPHAHIPVLAIPMSATRGATLLATLAALDVRVDTLLLCDSAPGVPELGCVAGEIGALAARGALPIGTVRVVYPRFAAGPVFGVSECWNALAREAFAMDAARTPWAFVMNDDVGFPPGTLGVAVAAVWEMHPGKSLLLANDGLPGVGYAFSAFALTREGYSALGPFDENFFPAYYEVRGRGTGSSLCQFCSRQLRCYPQP